MSPGPANMVQLPNHDFVFVSDSGTYTLSIINTALDQVVNQY